MPVADYYAILEIEPQCDAAAIKLAYRALARRWHPDANLDNIAEAESQFKNLAEAYQILGDREKRAKYDVFRPRVRRATPTPTKKENNNRSTPQPAPSPQKKTTLATAQLPPVAPINTARRKADQDLERAYTTFAAAFDREDEKSATFSGFFDTFMNVKK